MKTASTGPRRLTPSFREKVWGARHLGPWFPDSDRKIGEVWFECELPVLVKFLFTSEKLSVQVHPEDDYAREHHDSRGKTEMWHILAAEPGAKIAAGFKEPLGSEITPERLRSAALSGEIEELLEWFEARPGDTFFIPAGTVHAIGAGLALCEIQQLSDITYRLYDYGRPRELHLDHAMAVSRRTSHRARQESRDGTLVSCPYFTTTRLRIDSRQSYESASGPELLIAIEGSGEIAGQPVSAGDVWQMSPETQVEISGRLVLLRVSIP